MRKNAIYASSNGMHIKCDKVRIKRIVLDLHDVIADSRLLSLNVKCLFYLKLETRRGVIENMETAYRTRLFPF